MGEKKNVFLTKHQRKGNMNPVIFKLKQYVGRKKNQPNKKKHQPTKITEAVALQELKDYKKYG